MTLVDTTLPGFGPTLLECIKTVTDKPVTRIIDTHAHDDHTAGNPFFGRVDVERSEGLRGLAPPKYKGYVVTIAEGFVTPKVCRWRTTN